LILASVVDVDIYGSVSQNLCRLNLVSKERFWKVRATL